MSATEAKEFEQDPYFMDSIKVRAWDEQAKALSKPIVDLAFVKSLVRQVLLKTKGEPV